ncbi:MAG: tetratricopeptide repeat protein [Chloroflexota bacterium]
MADPSSETPTFFFTDIEGSTQLWERFPQAMRTALARHDAILRAAITPSGGTVFKTAGDAFYAVFDEAPPTVRAALAVQRALLAEDWGAIKALKVRIALHTGAADHREGDYFGPTVNRLARLLAAGHGGQILLSGVTKELVEGTLPPGIELRDLGYRRLKDLVGTEHLFQLLAPDLPTSFPPLRTLDTHPTNLPAQVTSLIGREREVVAVTGLLRQPSVRLLTLTGPGGVGKTRLSLQVGADLLDDFQGGVFFIPLGSIRDDRLVLPTIAQALKVKRPDDESLLDSLVHFLDQQRILLVMDNFEQVLEAAPLVTELLAAAPQLKALVSSRAVLQVYGEYEYPVPPLAVPRLPLAVNGRAVRQYPAVALFVERARAVQPEFDLTADNAASVVEICTRLDGLPLAIELAAANSRLFTPQAMLPRLSSRLRLLRGGPRDRPARQQSLAGALDWSYELLGPGERRLFNRLGVFVGGGDEEAISAVCNVGGDLSLDMTGVLATLVRHSMAWQKEDASDQARYGLLETIQEYALEKLTETEEMTLLRRRHAGYFLTLAETGERELTGPQQANWLNRLEIEHDNLRAALAWSLDNHDNEILLRVSGALWPFWYRRGHLKEGRQWLEAALTHGALLPPALRAKGLHGAGVLAYLQNNYGPAIVCLEESLAIRAQLGDKEGIANTLNNLGRVAEFQGDYQRAQAFYQESLTTFRQLDNQWGIIQVLNNLGSVALQQEAFDQATSLLQESLSLARAAGDRWGLALSLNRLGRAALYQDEYDRAGQLYSESLELWRELGDRWRIARVLHNLGLVAFCQKEYERAAGLCRESLVLSQELGDSEGIAACLEGLAGVAQAQGRSSRATRLCGAASALRTTIGAPLSPIAQWHHQHTLANARLELGEALFTEAWADGRLLTAEQAVEYVAKHETG